MRGELLQYENAQSVSHIGREEFGVYREELPELPDFRARLLLD